jgi:hypothetical protein
MASPSRALLFDAMERFGSPHSVPRGWGSANDQNTVPRGSQPSPDAARLMHTDVVERAVWRRNSCIVFVDGRDCAVIWLWSFSTNQLVRVPCVGDVPPPRTGHAIAVHDDTLYLHGGASTVCPVYPFYRMDLTVREWRPVTTMHGAAHAPQQRLRHTMTATGGRLLIYGGHPLDLSLEELRRAAGLGFYNVFSYDLKTGEWRSAAGLPLLFAHSAVAFGNTFVLFVGGLESRLDVGDAHSPPQADVSLRTYAVHTERLSWQCLDDAVQQGANSSSPGTFARGEATWREGLELPDTPSPPRYVSADGVVPTLPPRLRPSLAVLGSEVVVAGGIGFDGSGREHAVQDLWVLDVERRQWRRIESFSGWWCAVPVLATTADCLIATPDLMRTYRLQLGAKRAYGWSADENLITVSTEPLKTTHVSLRRSHSPQPQNAAGASTSRQSSVGRLAEEKLLGKVAASRAASQHVPPWAQAIATVDIAAAHPVAAAAPPKIAVDAPKPPRRYASSSVIREIAGEVMDDEPSTAPMALRPAAAEDRDEERVRLGAATFHAVPDDSPSDPLELLPTMRRNKQQPQYPRRP